MYTSLEVLLATTKILKDSGNKTPELDARIIIENITNKPHATILTNFKINGPDFQKIMELIRQRLAHKPIAYILGCKEFYGNNFIVNEKTLIPRPESELIVDFCNEIINENFKDEKITICDLGTGCGNLGISVYLNNTNNIRKMVLTDISNTTLDVAKQNASILIKDPNYLVFINETYFGSILDHMPDIVIANLPYVPLSYSNNPDLAYEPKVSLFSGVDGLDHYRNLFGVALSGYLPTYFLLEALPFQHTEILKIFRNYHLYKSKDLILVLQKDL